jgi:hypothetical protein
MNRTPWDIFQAATLSLTRAGTLKDRLNDAYHNHLVDLDVTELPKELREDFRSFNRSMTREPPLLRGEDSVRATIRKMSSGEAEAAATSVVKMFCALQRPFPAARVAATVVPLYAAAEPIAAEA